MRESFNCVGKNPAIAKVPLFTAQRPRWVSSDPLGLTVMARQVLVPQISGQVQCGLGRRSHASGLQVYSGILVYGVY